MALLIGFRWAMFCGGIKTNGAGVPPIEQHGAIETFRVNSLQQAAALAKYDLA